MSKHNGLFIMIDGIDGSGKSTAVKAWASYLENEGKRVFHLKAFLAEHHRLPMYEEIKAYDVLISAEPTTAWIGAAIRVEMIQKGSDYSAHAIANAFALDRLILYKRVLLPMLEAGKMVIQDRGVSTSLCYQSLEFDELHMNDIAAIEGNAFALEHAPDYLIIADVPVDLALKRIGNRFEKQDNAIFEQEDFLLQAKERFLSEEYQQFFTSRDTQVHTLDGSPEIAIMNADAIQLLTSFYS